MCIRNLWGHGAKAACAYAQPQHQYILFIKWSFYIITRHERNAGSLTFDKVWCATWLGWFGVRGLGGLGVCVCVRVCACSRVPAKRQWSLGRFWTPALLINQRIRIANGAKISQIFITFFYINICCDFNGIAAVMMADQSEWSCPKSNDYGTWISNLIIKYLSLKIMFGSNIANEATATSLKFKRGWAWAFYWNHIED